jgi:hypothetical protein
MKFTSLALAAAVLGASFSAAQADAYWKAGDLVPVASATQPAAQQPLIEGRQAAPIAQNSALDRYLIDRVDTSK